MEIDIITYNINCSNPNNIEERFKYIVKTIIKKNAKIVALQEVSKNIYGVLYNQFHNQYTIVQDFVNSPNDYGNVTLCKNGEINILSADRLDLQNKHVIYCGFTINEHLHPENGGSGGVGGIDKKTLKILNLQLEGLWNNYQIRGVQMESLLGLDEISSSTIIVGDFSIYRETEIANKLLINSNFKDAWTEIGSPLDVKYTYDYKKNSSKYMDKYRSRQDRVLFNLDAKVKEYTLLGISPLINKNEGDRPDNGFIYPSSHFGIYVKLIA